MQSLPNRRVGDADRRAVRPGARLAAVAGEPGRAPRGSESTFGRAKQVIVLYLHGGHPQQETFDPKPDGPSAVRGEFGAIATSVPGVQFREVLPQTARIGASPGGHALDVARQRQPRAGQPAGEHGPRPSAGHAGDRLSAGRHRLSAVRRRARSAAASRSATCRPGSASAR